MLTFLHQSGYPDPENFPEDLKAKRAEERQFLAQLLDGSKAEQYEIPVTINAELRRYQREGISWLAFLAKYRLHGILCDGTPFFKGASLNGCLCSLS